MGNEFKKTKVWQVIWGLKDGGAEVLAREYARLLDKKKFDVTIVTMYPFEDTANYHRAVEEKLKVVSIFKKRNSVTRVVRLLAGKWYVPMVLKRMLKKDRPDVIHFNSQMAFCFASLKKRLADINLLYTCHNELNKYFSQKENEAVRQLSHKNGLRLIALHEDMRGELDQWFSRNDTVVIRNGVDLCYFREKGISRDIVRERIGIAKDAYVVGHIGRISKQKNHAFLINVFQELVCRKDNAHLLLVGSGDLKEQLLEQICQQKLEKHVTMLSHRTDIPDLLHAMDVMVFPSLFEGLSVTLVEAQASGLRCVISDLINPANLLSENTIPVSLNADVKEWADIVLNEEIKNTKYGNIEEYDMGREIRRLERLYLGEQDV